jgi:chloramphenicol O-acetyltransferase type A
MHYINLDTWPRREHFEFFNTLGYPHFSMCANVDITVFYPAIKQSGISFTVGLVYVLARAANAIPEFRHRIRTEQVVEHDIVHPGFTILVDEDMFTFCMLNYTQNFLSFAREAMEQIAYVKTNPSLDVDADRDDWLFMTAIPWVSFTAFMHPIDLHPADSVPRFAWGKFFADGERLKLPLNVQGHHAVMDGLHVGRYYTQVQEYFDHPDLILDEA